MSKRIKISDNEMKESNKHASNSSETIAPSESITTDVKMDGKKVTKSSQISTDKIQAVRSLPQVVTKGMDDKEGRNRSTEDINVEEQGSDIEELDMTDEEIKDVVEEIESTTSMHRRIREFNSNSMEGNASSAQYQDGPNSLFESHRDFYKFLKSQLPELVKKTEREINIRKELKSIRELSDIIDSSIEMSKTEAKAEIYQVLSRELKKATNNTDEQFTTAILKLDDAANETTADLEKDGRKDVGTNYCDGSVDDIQKEKCPSQKITVEKKDGNGSLGIIQETEKSPQNMESEYDEESLMKSIDYIVALMDKAKDASDLTLANEILNVCPRQNISTLKSFQEIRPHLNRYLTSVRSKSATDLEKRRSAESFLKIVKENREHLFSKKEMTEKGVEAIEKFKASKEVDQRNNMSREVKKIESYKKPSTDNDISTEYIEVARQSPPNATEDQKEEKGNEDTDRAKGDIQDLHSDKEMLTLAQEIEYCKIKDNKDKIMYPEKTNILPVGDVKRDLKEYLTLQRFKLDEQVRKYRDMEFKKEKRNLFSLEKGPIAAVTETELNKEAEIKTNPENEEIEKIVETSKLDYEPKELFIELEQNDNIHFEFETNGDKYIFAGEKYYYYSIEKTQVITFNYKDESIKVSFNGNHILVSTQNSEFDIFVRKSNPVNLTNEATQT